MEKILIQLTNDKALKLLQELEDLHLIKLLERNINSEQTLSEKYAGKLSSATVEKIQEHIKKSRNEWN
ncbi:MAG TPA: hypothetical protein VGI61_11760 [Parafilimonas sp.]